MSPVLILTALPGVDEATRQEWSGVLSSFFWIDQNHALRDPLADTGGGSPRVLAAVGGVLEEIYQTIRLAMKHVRVRMRMVRRGKARFDAPAVIKGSLKRIRDLIHNNMVDMRQWFSQFTAEGRERRDRADDLRWLRRETRASPFLLQFRKPLRRLKDGGREQMLDELFERTDKYYDALWQMCSAPERVMLFHIAHYGVINANNRRVIRRLISRGLLTRVPELRVFNDTFRLFVLCHATEVRKQREKDPEGISTWDQLKGPLFIGLLIMAAVFLGTQKELANATSAIITALATGLPAIVKVIGTFTDRRLAAAQR